MEKITIHAKDFLSRVASSKSKTFLAFCFCFIAGAGIFSLPESYPTSLLFYLYFFVFVLFAIAIIFWDKKVHRFLILCSVFFFFGIFRLLSIVPDCENKNNLCHWNGSRAKIFGAVTGEPDTRLGETRYNLQATGEFGGRGQIQVNLPTFPIYRTGDRLELVCTLTTPKDSLANTFHYDKFLAKEGIFSLCQNPKDVRMVAVGSWSVKRMLFSLKAKVQNLIGQLWVEPEASFMAGLLYGGRSSLPTELSDNFSRTGVSHIMAVSGYNITIIATMLMLSLIAMGLWRQRAFWVTVVLVVLFTIFTGGSASVVRAAVMGLLALTAEQVGRVGRAGPAVVLAATLMALANPFVIFWDAGFQLSFLSTLGLIYLSKPLGEWLFLGKTELSSFQEMFLSTLSAIFATLPLILFQFGRLSMVAPLVNILILWIIPWLMFFGFFAIIVGALFFPLGLVIAWIAGIGLRYVIIVVEFFGRQSWAAVDWKIPWWGMVLMYLVIIFYVQKKRKSSKF